LIWEFVTQERKKEKGESSIHRILDTHYQFSIKTLLSKKSMNLALEGRDKGDPLCVET